MAKGYSDEELDDLLGGYSNIYRQPEPTQAIPEKPSPWRRVPDIGVMGLKGAVGLVESGIGLADIPTGGAVGRGLEKAGLRAKETQEILTGMYSPQQRAAQAAVSEGFREGFVPGITAAIRNPSTIAIAVGESAPSMLGGAAAARGLLKVAPKMAPWAAGAAGEGIVGMGSAAEQIRQQSDTGYLTPKQALAAVGSGLGTAAFGVLGGKLASKYGLGDVETALARGAVGKSDKGFIRRVVGSGISEGILEELPQSVQEQMWQNYATDRPLTEGLGEAAGMGLLAGGVMGAGVGALTKRRDLTKPAAEAPLTEPAPPKDLAAGLFPEAKPTPGAGINKDRYLALRKLGADHDMALQNSLLTGEHGALMDDALQQVAPATYRKDIEKQVSKAGGDIETATLAALSTEDAKQNYVYLRKTGMARAAAIKQAVAMPPVGSEDQGMLFSSPGGKGKFAYPGAAPSETLSKVQPLTTPKSRKQKPEAPIEDPLVAAAPTKAGKKAVADYNQRLSTGQITPEQHENLVNDIHSDIEVAKVNQNLRRILKENKGVGLAPQGAEVVQAGKTEEKVAPVTITTPEGSIVVQPEARKGDRSRKAEVGAASKPVATEPVPVVPTNAEDIPAYETAVAKYVMSGIPQDEWLAVARVRATEQDNPEVIGESFEVAAKALGISKTAARSRFNKGLSKMKANAQAAGLDWDSVAEILNITTPQAEVVSVGEAGQEGGRRAAVAPSEEFDPTYGMERGETTGEEGAAQEEGEAVEPGAAEIEIDAASALDAQITDTSERAIAAYPEEFVQMAETIWGEGFNDMPGFAQARFVRDVADMSRDARGDVAAFESGIERLKGERDGKKYTYDLAETVQGSDEAAAGQPESAGRGGRGDGEAGIVAGTKGAAGVEVKTRKSRKVAKPETAALRRSEITTKGWEFPSETIPQLPEGQYYDDEGNLVRPKISRSEITTSETDTGNTVASITKNLRKAFFSPKKMDAVVRVVQSEQDLPSTTTGFEEIRSTNGVVQGFYDGEVAWLIAKNIDPGAELAVVLHEVGVHMGMKNLLGPENYTKLTDQLKTWFHKDKGQAGDLARLAGDRVIAAQKTRMDEGGEKFTDEEATEEMLAYFVEEAIQAGINPSAMETIPASMREWFRALWLAISKVVRKLGINPASLTAEDVVNLAYGAAGLEFKKASGQEADIVKDVGATTRHFKTWDTFQNALPHIERTHEVTDMQKRADGSWDITTKKRGTAQPMFSIKASEASIVSAITEMGEQRGVGTEAVKYAAMMPFTRDLTKWASEYMESASGFWDAMNARLEDTTKWSLSTEKVLQQFLDLPSKSVGNALSSQDKVQKFLFDGKMEGSWGFQPEWIKDPVPVSATMKQKWAAMTTTERDAAKAVLKLFNELRKADIAAVRASVESFRKYADTLKDPETKKDIEDDVALKLKQMKTLAEYRGPYVPTMRFGDYAVEAMSKAYLAAEAAGDEAAMSKMKSDPSGKDYRYSQEKTQREANAAKAQLDADFKGGFVQSRPKFGHPVGKKADFSALVKIEGLMRKYTDKKGAGEVRSLLNTLMSDLSEEYSEVQSRQMFKAVSGAKWNEVMQGVAIRGKQMAFKIAALNHNREISNKLFDMRDEADKSPDSATAIHLWNEMEKRHTNSMDGEDINESVQNIMGAVSFWKLLTNPMYFITQLAQPYQYSIPSMVKVGLGYTDSWKAMWDAKETALDVLKQSKLTKSVAEDLSWAGKAHGKDVQEMLEWLQARNLLDMGINSEVGALEGAHIVKQKIERHAIRPLRNAVQNVELINRITTAIATYQLALKKTGNKEQARSITENVIADSHGLYAGMNAPRYLNQKDWRRIPVQFRKFQLIQATFLYRNLVQEFEKIKNPTERAAAMRTIAATLGHTLVVAGLKGSVLWLVVSSLMSLAGLGGDDEDDPRTNEEKAMTYLSDEYSPGFANFVMRGAPTTAGIDISARTSMNPLTLLPFDNQSLFSALSSQKAFKESVYTLAGGAFGSLAGDAVDGFDMMREGNWYKGAEKVLPLGLKNVMQAARYGSEGVSQRNGVVTLTPEELDWWDITQQALGAPPEVIKSAQRKRTQLSDTMEAFAERQKELKLDYQQAKDDGDTEAMQNVRREWTKMAGTMRGLGVKPPKITSLTKKQEPDVVGGVTVTKQTRRYLESMG